MERDRDLFRAIVIEGIAITRDRERGAPDVRLAGDAVHDGQDVGDVRLPSGPAAGWIPSDVGLTVARGWMHRAAAHRGDAAPLAVVASTIIQRSLSAELHVLAAKAITDKLRHAAICEQVARAYYALPEAPELRRLASPLAPAREESDAVVRVIAHYCVHETLTRAVLERAHEASTEPLPRAALTLMLDEQVDQQRIGIDFVAELAVEERRALCAPLAAMLDNCVSGLNARARELPDVAAPKHGILGPSIVDTTIDDTLRGIVLPRLRELGLSD